MAKIKLLVDTDIIIDALKGIKPARDLFRRQEIDIYCSILTKKELLSKEGLVSSEKKRIEEMLSKLKILRIDNSIHLQFADLLQKYGDRPEAIADYIIAATALAKRLPLLTRNKKHFEHIKEIILSPVYKVE
jgi:predicted nucleic acid-binding protein